MTFRGGGFPKAGLPGGASFFLISAECRHPLVLSVPTSSLPVREGCSGEGGEVARMGGGVIMEVEGATRDGPHSLVWTRTAFQADPLARQALNANLKEPFEQGSGRAPRMAGMRYPAGSACSRQPGRPGHGHGAGARPPSDWRPNHSHQEPPPIVGPHPGSPDPPHTLARGRRGKARAGPRS